MTRDTLLPRLARAKGVLLRHVDAAGRLRDATPRALRRVLGALGVDASTPRATADALALHRVEQGKTVLEPVHVAWTHGASLLPVKLPDASWQRPLRLVLHLESGRRLDLTARCRRAVVKAVANVDGTRIEHRLVTLPARLPAGYHRLALEVGSTRHTSLVMAAPPTAYDPPSDTRRWGVFLPLYAVRANTDWGAGDFGGLNELCHDVARLGGSVVSTLPLLPAFLDTPFEPSPYSPVSRLYWNEFYIDLETVPEAQSLPSSLSQRLDDRRRAMNRAMQVDYRRVMALKREMLAACMRRLLNSLSSARARAWRRHLAAHPDLERYARFRAVTEARGDTWPHWPEPLRQGDLRQGDAPRETVHYHSYVQWVAHEQLGQVTRDAHRRGVDLYLDMPLGVHRDGYDVWSAPHLFALGANGGCPPDPVFTKGQDWGFPPLHPEAQRLDGYAYVRRYLAHHLERARMLRLDHAMSLRRLYWVPCGEPATNGAYVNYPLEEWCALLCIESQRHRARIIGENLGTVPAEVNRAMRRHRFRELYVVQYEQRPSLTQPLRRIPFRCVASVNTHDMPPFAAHLAGLDIADRGALGLISSRVQFQARSERARMNQALAYHFRLKGLWKRGRASERDLLEALLRHLGSSRAETVLVNVEDLWLETNPQNVPGTSRERVNWRRKSQRTLAELRDSPESGGLLRLLREARRLAGKA